jgi:putative ABC transport system permease protein
VTRLLRWSWRDLRARWVQVVAIAFIVALGSGTYSGLSSTSAWRRLSYDASYRRLRVDDIHVTLSDGSYVDAATLAATATSISHRGGIRTAQARLIVPTQVDASTAHRTILVPGRIVGAPVVGGTSGVDLQGAKQGRVLRPGDSTTATATIDYHFAHHYGLPAHGTITVSANQRLEYVGQVLQPDYFVITGNQGNLLAEANYAVVFTSLDRAQTLAGRPGAANDLVVALKPGADLRRVEQELRTALAARFPDVGVKVQARSADRDYRSFYDDIANDQRFYNIFAVLILAAAAFAAFNLTGRMVEAQRREIGIGMALGVPPRRLAVRPVLAGTEIAVLGVVLGIGMGALLGFLMGSVLRGFVPLPVWRIPFQAGTFARGAALGLVIPIAATIYPVWQAVRVAPVDAIRTGALNARGRVPLLARIPLPGRTTGQLPFRNLLRAPRRTVTTVLGVAAAITVLIGVVGMTDSFFATIDRADHELLRSSPRRLSVDLASFVPESSSVVTGVRQSPVVSRSSTDLRLGGTLFHGTAHVDTLLQLVDIQHGIWTPTIAHRRPAGGLPGIVVSAKAAHDLGTGPGRVITLRHPQRSGLTSYRYVRSRVRVIGITPLPTRYVAFMDLGSASIMGLSGITNTMIVVPRAGVTASEAERALFGQPGVASVQPVQGYTDSVRHELARVLDILLIVEGAVLLLALLIAFNSASINADERARDHATMFAFGLPVRRVVRMAITESAVMGVLGTAVGVLLGWVLLGWLIQDLLPRAYPDLGIVSYVAPRTLMTAAGVGVLAVALAPLLTIRKLRAMDIPSTLRVVE